jgi:molybdopterin molybdotransferase
MALSHRLEPAPCGCDSQPASGELLSVDLAVERGLRLARPVAESENVALEAATGRVLAEPLHAAEPQPPFDNSAMDGYALTLSALSGEGPWRVPVTGRVAAGDSGIGIDISGAVRILTGAPVPSGLDAVVMQEQVEAKEGAIVLRRKPAKGENVRRRGEDIGVGQLLLAPGDRLTPGRLAVAASLGAARLAVRRKVRVAIFSTGSELRQPGEPLASGQIYNSNRYLLRALLSRPQIETIDMGARADRPEALAAALAEAARTADVVITTGGVSVGDEDHMPRLVREHGEGRLHVLNVAMKPGKPLTLGEIGEALYIGLPGNPVAAHVTFRLIARPLIDRIAGLQPAPALEVAAVSGFRRRRRAARCEYLPVRVTGRDAAGLPIVEMLGRGSSAALAPIAMADGLAAVEPGTGTLEAGERVRFLPSLEG